MPTAPTDVALAILIGGAWVTAHVARGGWSEDRRSPDESDERGVGRNAYPRPGTRYIARSIPFTLASQDRETSVDLVASLSQRPLQVAGWLTRGAATGIAVTVRPVYDDAVHIYAGVEGELWLDPPAPEEAP